MSYTPTEWKSGDIVTAAKLNKLEQGVAAGGSGGALVVNASVDQRTEKSTLDKTWQEIYDAAPFVMLYTTGSGASGYSKLGKVFRESSMYGVRFSGGQETFEAHSANEYPSTGIK